MPHYTDQLNRSISLSNPPQRIISLVPSQTELLFDLGLAERIVGRTKFCIHPKKEAKKVEVIGGTKNLRIEQIKSLSPDLIIANKEENVKEQVEELETIYPMWVSEVANLADALAMITGIGEVTQTIAKAKAMANTISTLFQQLETVSVEKFRTLYLIWQKPYMAAGNDTFIHHMMEKAGFENVIKTPRYPEVTLAKIQVLAPEVIMLSSEPFPFKEKHIESLKKEFPRTRIVLVDGEPFSWYGSRLLKTPTYLRDLRENILARG